jgi:sugar lactone lactonase YvrE
MLKANGIVANDAGALFFTSNKNVIFAYKAGKLIDLAGSGKSFPFSEGVGAAATFYDPLGLAYYSGQLVVADTLDHLIRRIESLEGSGKWKVSTLAGILGKTGSVDGDGADAKFYNPTGIAINSNGDIYVSDRYNHRIRKVNLISEFPLKVEVSTIAGKGVVVTAPPEGKVPMLEYPFGGPFGIAVLDDPDKLVVSNAITHHLTQIDLAKGTASVLAGANSDGFVDKVKASAARFSDPHGIASTHTGVIYVADTGNNRIRRVCYVTSDNYWYVDTVAGTGVQGRSDGGGDSATFTMPQDVAVGPNGSIYVVDNPKIAIGHSNIRKIEINPL